MSAVDIASIGVLGLLAVVGKLGGYGGDLGGCEHFAVLSVRSPVMRERYIKLKQRAIGIKDLTKT